MGFRACSRSALTGHACIATWYGEIRFGSRAAEFSVTSSAAPTALLSSTIDIPALPGWAHIWAAGPTGLERINGLHIHRYLGQPVKRSRQKANLGSGTYASMRFGN